ncbi:MAG: MMPL family transporter [Aureliella sp.]
MNRIFEGLSAWSAHHRGGVLVLLGLISAGALLGYFDPTFYERWQSKTEAIEEDGVVESKRDDTDRPPPNVQPMSLDSASAALVIEADDFFNPDTAAALRGVVDAIEDLPQVGYVLWLDRVPVLNIFGLPEPLLPKSRASEQRFAAAKEKALANPLVGGQLLSRDGRTMLMLINYNYDELFSDYAATTEIVEVAREAADAFDAVQLRIRITGQTPMYISAVQSHEANQLRFQLIGYGMILLMAAILFRGIRAVVIVALAPVLGVFWTLGYISFFEVDGNPLVDVVVPILVSLVGLTDGVHMMVQIRKNSASGMSRRDAAQAGLAHVGLACFLTSLTTAIGFGSLLLADSDLVQEFGFCSMIGVLLCFAAVVLVIPLLCNSWLGNKLHHGLDKSPIESSLAKLDGLIDQVVRWRVLLSIVAIISTVAMIGLASSLRPDQRESDGLPQQAEATQAMQHVDKAFGGLEYSSVDIRWDDSVASDAPEVLEVVCAVDDLLRDEPLIASPLSIRNLIDAQPGEGPISERMSLLELTPPPLKRMFYTPEYRSASVTFRVQDLGIAAYGPTFTRIEEGLERLAEEYPQFKLGLDGRAVWRWENLYQIVVDLAASLGTASIIILIVLTVVYRSIRLGLISIIPNLFPLAVTAAFLWVAGYNLEIAMVCSFTVCLGIAVDDTIHFLTRYREELQESPDPQAAIRKAFTSVGSALIMTTAVLVAGFSVVAFSDSRDHRIFAIMGALTISAALFCDLIFLPALLAWLGPRAKDVSGESKVD